MKQTFNITEMKNQDERWHTNPNLWEKLKPEAYKMRRKPTEAEKLLWRYLRDGNLKKCKFRHQHSLGQFIVDFYCRKAKLVIEVDGLIHKYQLEEGKIRQEYLENHKYKVLRFSNDSIIYNVGIILEQIKLALG